MSKLQHLRKALDPSFVSPEDRKREADLKAVRKAFQESMDSAVAPVREAIRAAQGAIEGRVAEAGQRPFPDVETPLKQAQQALDVLVKSLGKSIAEQIKVVEAAIIAEIRAIPAPRDVVIPKAERVDLSPVMAALEAMRERPEAPKAPEAKILISIDPVRNRNTGLVERYEFHYK